MYRSHSGQVWRAVLAMTAGRGAVADEATAEAFARLFVHRERVHDPVGWVFRTAFRLAVREMKREGASLHDCVWRPMGVTVPVARLSRLACVLLDDAQRVRAVSLCPRGWHRSLHDRTTAWA